MEGEKIFSINGVHYKCIFMYGYNNHYYCTVYNDDTGRYIGEIVDIRKGDNNLNERITNFVEKNI